MNQLWQDLRYGVRMLSKHPGFTCVAILTLALGIGANTAIFSVVNGVLLRPLPYRAPEQLVSFRSNESVLDVADIKAWNQSFAEIGGNTLMPLDYTSGGEPRQWRAGLVTGGFFPTLGVPPLLGRSITPEDDQKGRPFVAVLSYGLWQQEFGRDPNIVGRTVNLSGNGYTVIGVMPEGFKAPRDDSEVWCPVWAAYPAAAEFRGVHFLQTYARLRDGITAAQAQAEMVAIDRRLAEAFPAENKRRQAVLIPLHERVVGAIKPALLVLFGAVGLVLLIACANFAGLLLARAAGRTQELVVRVALGAGRGRLLRQMLTESLLLATLGGAAGAGLAAWGVELLRWLKPASLPRLDAIHLDTRVLLFTLGLSLVTGLLFGLIPAWQATRINTGETLKEGGRGSVGAARHRLRSALVVVEIALALVLLVGAGLLLKSFWRLRSVAPGFNPEHVAAMRIELPEARYREIPKQAQYRSQLLDEVNALPGVQAALVSELPMSGDWLTHDFLIEGQQLNPGEEPDVQTRSIEGDYFRVMQIPLLVGRDFTAQDGEKAPLVGVINQTLAQQFFAGQNPLGKRVRWARNREPAWITIIGVVGDVKHFGLDAPEEPAVYTPYAQSGAPWKRWMNLVARSGQEPGALAALIKSRVWRVDAQLPVTRVRALTEVIGEAGAARRFSTLLLALFAAVAVTLAAAGIYGVMSYLVTQRTHELGIRIALGARGADVLRLILRGGLTLALLGVACGALAALALTRLLKGFLFGVAATDPLTFLVVALLLTAVALAACWLPARRATKVDPMVALRAE